MTQPNSPVVIFGLQINLTTDIERHWTHSQLDKAFDVVKDQTDWKAPIDVILSGDTSLEDLALYTAAIQFFTATEAKINYGDYIDGGFRITAPGYRAGPAGDH
jgi:hypothetical protein